MGKSSRRAKKAHLLSLITFVLLQCALCTFALESCLYAKEILLPEANGVPFAFKDNHDGTISDLNTGIMWEKRSESINEDWDDATKYCASLSTGGYSDWRLPTLFEISTLYAYFKAITARYEVLTHYFPSFSGGWTKEKRDNNNPLFFKYDGTFFPMQYHIQSENSNLCARGAEQYSAPSLYEWYWDYFDRGLYSYTEVVDKWAHNYALQGGWGIPDPHQLLSSGENFTGRGMWACAWSGSRHWQYSANRKESQFMPDSNLWFITNQVPMGFVVWRGGNTCSYSVSEVNKNITANEDTYCVKLSMTSYEYCNWSVFSKTAWATITSDEAGTGAADICFHMEANTSGTSRTAKLNIAGFLYEFTQPGASACTFSVSSLSNFSDNGGTQPLSLTASGSDCTWTASTNSLSWVHLSAASGTGSGSLHVTVDRNNTTDTRSGTITVAGQSVTVTQAGAAACTYTVSSLTNFSSGSGSQTLNITASSSNCAWAASTNSLSWAHLSATGGTGSGQVTVSVDQNTDIASRSGTIIVAGKSVTVNQAGASCSFTVSSINNFVSAASSQTATVTASNPGCTWTASESLDWVSLSSTGGTGNGSVTVSVTQNNTASTRSGTVSIAGQTITVTQAAVQSCSVTLSALHEFYNTANSQAISITASGSTCTWAASGSLDWVSFYPTSGTGSGTVVVSVKKNTSTSRRIGVVTIAGQSVTITQAAYSPRKVTLPDTGQTKCFNNSAEITCPARGADFYGQDGNYRGTQPSYKGNGDTVTDLVTGLMWQQADDGVARNWVDAVNYCKNLNLGNSTTWRLPSSRELSTIVDSGQNNPAINPSFSCSGIRYWSSTSYFAEPSVAWAYSFKAGDFEYRSKSILTNVRCVSGAPLQESVYIDNSDGTVADQVTGLVWEKAGTASPMTWEQALAWCEQATTGGYSDWRLPNQQELRSLLDLSRSQPTIDTAFTGPENEYWSGTTYAGHSNAASYVYFHVGYSYGYVKSGTYNVRCVRGGHGASGPFVQSIFNILLTDTH